MPQKASKPSIQSFFLDQVKSRLADTISFPDKLAEILEVSRDSAYRRIRGETVLSLDEAKKLCDRFGVSIDALLSPSINTSLFYHRAMSTSYTLEQWLTSVGNSLTHINTCKEKEMIFAARDMPMFHNFRLEELSTFKMFFWLKTVIKDPVYTNELFHSAVIPSSIKEAAKKLWKLYEVVPSSEIWSDVAIHEMLRQIEYYAVCGFFQKTGDATLLCDRLLDLLNFIQAEAQEGKKASGVEFKLFENEILIANNTVLARMDHRRIVYINYNTLNLLTTHQESFCDKTEQYLNNLYKNSILISSSAEKERNRFFNKMKERVELAKARIR